MDFMNLMFDNIPDTRLRKIVMTLYSINIVFDAEADIFHGEVVNMRDVITFQGKSTDELKQAFKDSIEDYLEFCSELGENPEKPFSGRFTINLPPELHRKVIRVWKEKEKNRLEP